VRAAGAATGETAMWHPFEPRNAAQIPLRQFWSPGSESGSEPTHVRSILYIFLHLFYNRFTRPLKIPRAIPCTLDVLKLLCPLGPEIRPAPACCWTTVVIQNEPDQKLLGRVYREGRIKIELTARVPNHNSAEPP